MKMSLSYFLRSEDGAVTVDWVVLTAAVVGLGMTSVAAVRTGTSSLGDATGTALSSGRVSDGIFVMDGFEFLRHVPVAQRNALALFRDRTDDELLGAAGGQSRNSLNALAEGDLDTARFWAERRYISEIVMRERGLTANQNQQSSANLIAAIEAAP
jgi:Flp pilus assembly pilin Flp